MPHERLLPTVGLAFGLLLALGLLPACTTMVPTRPPLPALTQDFLARCQTPGVIRCVGFNAQAG
jgi:hypothetical protein